MNGAKRMKAFLIVVLLTGLWVISVIVYLFNGQKITPNVTYHQSLIKAEMETKSELLESRHVTKHYNEDFELQDIAKGLNKHTWKTLCHTSLEQLCSYPIFPKAPDDRNFVQNANIMSTVNELESAVRLLGYVRPNATGEYQFLVTSNGFVEVWLSPNTNWKDAVKVAYSKPRYLTLALKELFFEAMKSQTSVTVSLVARQKYFFEVIYVKTDTKSSEQLIQVAWKRPDRSEFELIEGEYFSLYTADSDKAELQIYDDELPDVLACEKLRKPFANKYMRPDNLPYLSRAAVDKTLPLCEYRPSYLLNPANLPPHFKMYDGIYKHVQKIHVYLVANVSGVVTEKTNEKRILLGQPGYPLSETESLSVIHRYLQAMHRMYPQ